MNLEKALTIFGLEKNYTEEELKKRYHELMRENHPDYHMNTTEQKWNEYNRKTQDINEAHEVLKRNLKNKTNSYQNNNYQKYSPEDSFIQNRAILNSYYTMCDDIELTKEVQHLVLNYIVILGTNPNHQKVIQEFKNKLKELYQNYILTYSKINNIPFFIIKNYKFNYDCNCAKLYSQLQSCKNKIEDDIKKTIQELKIEKHYSILKEIIDKEINSLKQELHNHELTEEAYKTILSTYSSKINNIYDNYNRKYHRLILLFNIILPQLEPEIRNKLSNKVKLIALKTDDIELSKMYNEMLEEFNYNPQTKDEIYNELRNLYLNSNPEFQELNNKLFLKVTELLFSKECEIEILLTICKITFTNPQKELEKLEQIEKIFKRELPETEEFFCIRKSKSSPILKAQKIKSDNNQTSYYKVKCAGYEDTEYDEETFEKIYLPIEKFLVHSTYLGYESFGGGPIIQLFYYNLKTGKILGRIKKGPFRTFDESILKRIHFAQKKNLHSYLNEKYLEHELSNAFEKEYNLMSNYDSKKHRK